MTKKFARLCSATKQGMNKGYCFYDGEAYFKNESDALEYAQGMGFKTLKEAYDKYAYYYTDWHINDENEWYEKRGGEWYVVRKLESNW